MAADTQTGLTAEQLAEIERKFDPETAFRPTGRVMGGIIAVALAAMSLYHFYAKGFALIRELLHFGIHLAFVLGLGFLLFSWRRAPSMQVPKNAWSFDGVNILDIIFCVLAVGAALYLPLLPPEIVARRVSNPSPIDLFMGSSLLLITLEVARRSIGPTLPIIALVFILFALFGQYAPGALKHGGNSWTGFINHIYMTNQGIYGVAIGAMAKYVFLFILFGALATKIGLGQLFIDLASVIAGRYAGGPAKVAICASAFMGSISGSSIGNTVTTGALTIPAMKRVGYPPHFAGAVEATASTGGQITPPVMGAAAFIMVDYLGIPLKDVLAAALFPAILHYFGILVMVHLQAKKLGLRGLRGDELPQVVQVLKEHFLTLIPLGILIYMILTGRTPEYAAVYAIIACVIVGFVKTAGVGGYCKARSLPVPDGLFGPRALWDAMVEGARGTIAIGAAAACVGIIVGVVTLTGSGFRVGSIVITTANDIAGFVSSIWLLDTFSLEQWSLFFSLVLVAIACIVMGAGVPTTATYIILVSVTAGAFQILGVEPLVAHFFVFYYGVLADITPPVALAAYAAAGIAGSNPFKTGNTAFSLGIAKALVPFVFVYSPALLLVAEGFTWTAFAITLTGAALGIGALGIAFTGYLFVPLSRLERWWVGLVSLLFIAPGIVTMGLGLALIAPVVMLQLRARSRQAAA